MSHLILFLIFAALCVGGAINLLVQRHPINSALSLVLVTGSLALIYLLLGAEFVAAIQVIIYAGAVMVLFIFVIMLLNAGAEEETKGSRVAILLGVPGLILGISAATWVLVTTKPSLGSVIIGQLHGTGRGMGRLLFRDFLLPFEVTSVLILIAIMGAVVLTRRGNE
ncbi:MAG: NADH-quinone oxidoreductase subunit J [Candidatus Korobacteraceae bacterium]|jgi:NADH-quinone oxidoreductase subunit J